MPEVTINGPAGRLEGRYTHNKSPNAPIALVLHPHPQHGGTMNNRVVYTLFQSFVASGFSTLRINFRGVGAGFVVVPALVAAMKLPIKKATATALVVIVINSAVAAVVRHDSLGSFDVAAGLAVAAATFAVGGALLSRRIPGWILSGAFGSLMVLVAVYTVARSVTGG